MTTMMIIGSLRNYDDHDDNFKNVKTTALHVHHAF